jgi:hypothetical protein
MSLVQDVLAGILRIHPIRRDIVPADDVNENTPTFNQLGGTIWHFFFNFKFIAIHNGILHLVGGRRGPYAPWSSASVSISSAVD